MKLALRRIQLSLQVLNLRTRAALRGEGFNLKPQNLYYLSVHTLDSQENVRFARDRVGRELLDLWIDQKISFAGLKFEEQEQTLSESDSCLKNYDI